VSEHLCTQECVPPGLVAIRPNGERVPVAAEPELEDSPRAGEPKRQVRTKGGDYVLLVRVPEGPVDAFAADGPLPDGHAFTFVSPEWVRDQARKALSMDKGGDDDRDDRDHVGLPEGED